MRALRGVNAYVQFIGSLLKVVIGASDYLDINGKRFYFLTTNITANSTVTTVPAGSIGVTTSTTGRMNVFVADGAKWQALGASVSPA